MRAIEIRRPGTDDVERLHRFFELVIADTFEKEGISGLIDDMEQEIEGKRNDLYADLNTSGKEKRFYVALHNESIIGTIAVGPASKLIRELTNGALDTVPEIGSALVHPGFQGQGVASVLLNAVFLTLIGQGVVDFCLDCGYKNAQRIWIKKFGEPAYRFENYWGDGADHMIWQKKISDQVMRFTIK